MKRDMDLVRKILFAMEESNQVLYSSNSPPKIDGYSRDEIVYHMRIMSQSNLLAYEKEVDIREYSSGVRGQPNTKHKIISEFFSISWQGHEFLDALRSDTIWQKVKDTMANAGGFVLEIAISIGKEYIKREAMKYLS